MSKSKKYLITVLLVNFIFGFIPWMVAILFKYGIVQDTNILDLPFFPISFVLFSSLGLFVMFIFNIISPIYVVRRFKSPDKYARIGFWLSIIFLIAYSCWIVIGINIGPA